MLGINALAAVPLAGISVSQTVPISGEALSLVQNALATTASAAYTLVGQTIPTTLSDLSISNQLDIYLTGQSITTTQNALRYGVVLISQEITSTLNAVTATAACSPELTGQSLSLEQKSVSLYTQANANLTSQTIHMALHSMRMWKKINTAQSPGWTEIET